MRVVLIALPELVSGGCRSPVSGESWFFRVLWVPFLTFSACQIHITANVGAGIDLRLQGKG